jgi:integrase
MHRVFALSQLRSPQSVLILWTELWTDHAMGKLNARKVETAKPGKYGDGDGLQLVVAATGARKWVLRVMRDGKARELGLGSFPTVSLLEAREKAAEIRKQVRAGIGPKAAAAKEKAIPTFKELADEVIGSLEKGFRNAKHRAQWKSTIKTYAASLHDLRVDAVGTDDVLEVLKPIWTEKPETASRVRGRIEKVLDAARAKGFRTAENPARWRGHLDHLLPKAQKLARGHHAAMPYEAVPAFVEELRKRDAMAALALEFLVLTAARSGEVLGASWSEIDLEAKVWTVPANRMKANREHRVPLVPRAIEILEKAKMVQTSDFVFPGQKAERPLSVMALEMVLRRMKIEDATVHGFRSSFRDWAGNETAFQREVAEQALAHVIGDKAEQAYRRGDALDKRRALMEAWGNFVEQSECGNVVLMRSRA